MMLPLSLAWCSLTTRCSSPSTQYLLDQSIMEQTQRVPSPLSHCPFCRAAPALAPSADVCKVWGLSYSSGFAELELQRRVCRLCRATFLGCWAFPHGGMDRPRLASHPDMSPWFFFRERFHAGSFVAPFRLPALHDSFLLVPARFLLGAGENGARYVPGQTLEPE